MQFHGGAYVYTQVEALSPPSLHSPVFRTLQSFRTCVRPFRLLKSVSCVCNEEITGERWRHGRSAGRRSQDEGSKNKKQVESKVDFRRWSDCQVSNYNEDKLQGGRLEIKWLFCQSGYSGQGLLWILPGTSILRKQGNESSEQWLNKWKHDDKPFL